MPEENQSSPVWNVIYYDCPECHTCLMETRILAIAHTPEWERRTALEPCCLCKRDEERMDAR